MEKDKEIAQNTNTLIENQNAAQHTETQKGDADAVQNAATLKGGDTDVVLIDAVSLKSGDIHEAQETTVQKEVVDSVLVRPTLKLKDIKAAQRATSPKVRDKNDEQKTTEKKFDKEVTLNTTQEGESNIAAQNTVTQIKVDDVVFKKTITPNELIIEDTASSLSHDELLEVTNSSLFTLTCCDSLLSDLPEDVMLEEVLSHIAVEHGQAITVFISREDEPQLKVIVPQTSTVRELKKAINRHFEMYQKRKRNKVKISWKYIWRTYDLNYDGIILDNDVSSIDDYNITNKVTLTFKKKKKKKKNLIAP